MLHGIIERETFPGPPNYESVALGDAPETYWLLRVDSPICIGASLHPPANVFDRAQASIDRLQLVFLDERPYDKYQGLVGHAVTASGVLFGAQTGHHHTEALLTVKRLELASHETMGEP